MRPLRVLAVLCLALCSATTTLAKTLEIGVLAHRDKETIEARWAPIADYLNSTSFNYQFEFKPLYFDELERAVSNREIEFVFANPSFYIYLQERFGLSSPLVTLVNRYQDRRAKAFGGVIFAAAGNDQINDLDDIRGRSVAVVNRKSLGGFQMEVAEIERIEEGLTQSLRIDELGMPHDNTVYAVLEGSHDLGFARTGVIEKMVDEGVLEPDALKVLNVQPLSGFPFTTSTQLYPEWPLAALPNTDSNATKLIIARLLQLQPNALALQETSIGGFDTPANYISVERIMREQRVPPFENIGTITVIDIWEGYSLVIVLGVVLLLVLLGGYVMLLRLNQQLASARTQLAEEKVTLDEILWATRVGTWTWNLATTEVNFNARWAEMLGYRLEELKPISFETWQELVHPEDLPSVETSLHRHLAGEADHYEEEVRMRHKQGHWVWILTKGNVVERDGPGNPIRVSGTHHDISERKLLESEREAYRQQLEVLATKDNLTNLFNRRYFMNSASRLFDIAVRYKQPLSYLMIDADDFKLINDRYGHEAGDKVLQTIAEVLESNIRQADLLARLGGEEFGILMPQTDAQQAFSIANRITELAKQRIVESNDYRITFSLSIGVSERTAETNTLSDLMVYADQALYAVKRSGKGHARLFNLAVG